MAKPHIMYLGGGDELVPEVESLSVVPVEEEDAPGKTVCKSCYLPNLIYTKLYYMFQQLEIFCFPYYLPFLVCIILIHCVFRKLYISQSKSILYIFM